jgi:hypothetical protein
VKTQNYIFYGIFSSLALASFLIGYKSSMMSLKGKSTARVYVQGRVVAETARPVRKPLLIDEKLMDSDNIIASAVVVKDSANEFIGLKFGNFISEFGQSLCSAYSKVEVILFGDGVAVSGQPPRMIFSGECPRNDKAETETLSNQVSQAFPLFLISDCNSRSKIPDNYQLENGTTVIATNIDFMLSEPDWIVEKISFIDETNPRNAIEFNFEDIKKIRSKSGLITVNCD